MKTKLIAKVYSEKCGDFSGWVANCSDFNICAQGNTPEEAKSSFARTAVGQFMIDQEFADKGGWKNAGEVLDSIVYET